MTKLTVVAFLVIFGVVAINGLRIRPIYNYDSPDLRLVPGRNGRPRLVRVYDRPDKPDHLVITQGRGPHRRTYVTDNVDSLYDSPMMGAHTFQPHHAYSNLGKRKRRAILHPFHRARLFPPMLAHNFGLGLALRARALGALSYRNRFLGAHGLLGQGLVRPATVAQVTTQVGQHKTPAQVTQVATKQAPEPIPSAPAVVPSKVVDPYPAPTDVYQPGPGIDTGIPTYVEHVGHPYNDIFDQPAGGQPLQQEPAGLYNDPTAFTQSPDLHNSPGALYNDPAGAHAYPGTLTDPIHQGTNGASDIFSSAGGFGASNSHLSIGDFIVEGNGQHSLVYDNNAPSNMVGTAVPNSPPSFM